MPIVPPVSWAASGIREAISGTDILHSLSSATTQSSSPVGASRGGRVESASRSIWLAEYGISHLSDNVILLQYLRADTRLRRSVTVLKSRASATTPKSASSTSPPTGSSSQTPSRATERPRAVPTMPEVSRPPCPLRPGAALPRRDTRTPSCTSKPTTTTRRPWHRGRWTRASLAPADQQPTPQRSTVREAAYHCPL